MSDIDEALRIARQLSLFPQPHEQSEFLRSLPRGPQGRGTGKLEYVRDLNKAFGQESQKAIQAVRRATRNTNHEVFSYGSHTERGPLTYGSTQGVQPPERFEKWAGFSGPSGMPFFTVHTHPRGNLVPSGPDLNYRARIGGPQHHMLIEAMEGPHNRLLVTPHEPSGLAAGIRTYMPLAQERFNDANRSLGLHPEDPTMYGGLMSSLAAKSGIPLYIDKRAQPTGGSGTLEEMLPEMIGHLKRHGDWDYAQGGTVEESDAFKDWYKDSKIRHEDGRPMRLYHGTADDIQSFDLDHPNRKDAGWLGHGIYLSSDPALASGYAVLKRGTAAPNVMPLYANLKNPYYATLHDKERMMLYQHARGHEAGREMARQWTEALKARGHDGVVLKYRPEDVGPTNASHEVVVFDPASLKSAVGNQGTFSTKSHDITRAEGGEVDPKQLEEKMLQHFGETRDPWEAGYILPSGRMLDLTGRHYATGYERTAAGFRPKLGQRDYLRGTRSVDHRELPEELYPEGGAAGMFRFMRESGAVRNSPGYGISIVKMPSIAQLRAVVRAYAHGDMSVDVEHPTTMQNLGSKWFDRGPTAAALRKFIAQSLENKAEGGEVDEPLPLYPGTGGGMSPVAPWDSSDPARRAARYVNPMGFYSQAAEIAKTLKQDKGSPEQFKGALLNAGAKPDELHWSGYDQAMAGKTQISRDDLARHFNSKMPKIRETVNDYAEEDGEHGGAKYGEYTLPGGENYREVLLHLPPRPERSGVPLPLVAREIAHDAGDTWDNLGPNGRQHYENLARREIAQYGHNHRTSHWDTPNVLVHLRMSDRSKKGDKSLHLEELQSDWAQEVRQKGFRGREFTPEERTEYNHLLMNMTPDQLRGDLTIRQRLHVLAQIEKEKNEGVPRAPYVDSTSKWVDLGLKRALVEAARGGHQRILITPGKEQAERFDLGHKVRELQVYRRADGRGFNVNGKTATGEPILHHAPDEKALAETIGLDLSRRAVQRLHEQNPGGGTAKGAHFKGEDLRIGDEGMRAFYDEMLPRALEKLAKRHDPEARVRLHSHPIQTLMHDRYDIRRGGRGATWRIIDTHTPMGEQIGGHYPSEGAARRALTAEHGLSNKRSAEPHSLEITPKMRESILKGLPIYHEGGAVPDDDVQLPKAAGGSVNHHPTEAQKVAGNYAKQHLSFQGLPIAIENKLGSVRSGPDARGRPWSSTLPADYGYIKRTEGADGDHVDCYMGPHHDSHLVTVVNQLSLPDRRFDEHKCLLGFKSEREALACYVKAFSDGKGKDRIGSVEVMSIDAFKRWLKDGKTTKPARSSDIVDRALRLVSGR